VRVHAAHSQDRHAIRLEWGPTGARELATYAAGRSDVVAVVVDVLSFTTCVSVAVDKGMRVHPYPWRDDSAEAFAAARGALLAKPRAVSGPSDVSLSPASIRAARHARAIVLPSPNGSTISALLGDSGATVVAASLRNASAVGRWLAERVNVRSAFLIVPAGERWDDGTLRPAVEDLWGAGAVIDELSTQLGDQLGDQLGALSPEAALARQAYRSVATRLDLELAACASGRELLQKGYALDLAIAAEREASARVPVLRDGAFVPAG
jgi:2-phosphosulfolactate phosphatase